MSYKIRAEHVPTLADRLGKIAKRAIKLNLPLPTFSVLREWSEEVPAKDGIGFPQIVSFAEVEVEGEAPKINGWEFIATLEHDEGDVLVRAIPGVEVPSHFRSANPDNCDHCGKARRRSNTYVLRMVEDAGVANAQHIQVGSDCVRDFIGYDSPEAIARQIEAISEIERELSDGEYEDYDGPKEEARYPLSRVVEVAVAAVRLHGWTPKSKADEYGKRATVEYVVDHLLAKAHEVKRKLDIVAQDKVDSEALLIWGREAFAAPRSDYDHNMSVLLSKEDVRFRQLGFVCSLVGAWRKAQAQKIEREAQPVSEWMGEVGAKVEAQVKVLAVRGVETDYGLSHLVLFSAGGNILKWFSSNLPEFCKEGAEVKIVGTVKSHETYREVKQTAILRVKESLTKEEVKARKAAKVAAETEWVAASNAYQEASKAHYAKWARDWTKAGAPTAEEIAAQQADLVALNTGPIGKRYDAAQVEKYR